MDFNGNDATNSNNNNGGGDSSIRIKPIDNIIISQETTSGQSLPSNSSANVVLGFASGVLTTSNSNVFIGKNAGKNCVNGTNTSVGTSALRGDASATVSGNGNSCLGQQALQTVSSADDNSCVGKQAMKNLTTGDSNVCFGKGSGLVLTAGSHNTLLGTGANVSNLNAQYAISIGADSVVAENNSCVVGGSTTGSRINSIITGVTNTCDLGNSSRKFKDIHLQGRLICGSNNTVVNFSAGTPAIGDTLRATSTTAGGFQPRILVVEITNQDTYTPNINLTDQLNIVDQAQAFTIANPSGSQSEAQRLTIRAKCAGTNRGITWGNIYRAMGVALPSTLLANKTLYLGLIYNGDDTKWDLVSSSQQA